MSFKTYFGFKKILFQKSTAFSYDTFQSDETFVKRRKIPCHNRGFYKDGIYIVMGKFNVIEEYAKIKSSILWNYNNLKKGSSLIDCLTGSECTIEEEMVYEGAVLGSGMKNIYENYFQKLKV